MNIRTMWLVGCGNMAGAMLRRWIDTGVIVASDVFVLNRRDQALPEGVQQGRELPEGALPHAVMLGVKPQQLDDIAVHAARLAGVPLLISILAGVEPDAIAARFSAGTIVRAMPNLPVAFGKGVVALNGVEADTDARVAIDALMASLGLNVWIEADQFDAVTALAGSGPAFVYRFIDALAEAGCAVGLPVELAQRLAIATVEGGALAAAGAPESPSVLADRVASKGGSTRAGLNVLDTDQALVRLLTETLAAATRRNAEMAAAARGEGNA